MRSYKGLAKCGGCGKSGQDEPRRSKQQVCFDCERLLELGRGVKEKSAGFSVVKLARYHLENIFVELEKGARVKWVKAGKYVGVRMDEADYEGSSRHLMDKLNAFIATLDEGIKDTYEYRIGMAESFETYQIRTPIALTLVEFLEAVYRYGERCQEEGFADGKSLLVNLAVGKMSVDDFNRKTIGK